MFKLFSSTKPAEETTKVSQAPKEEPAEAPEPASEQREITDGRDAVADLQRDAAEKLDYVFNNVESVACANDNIKGAVDYVLAQGHNGDIIDKVFYNVENMACADETMIEDVLKCEITKDSKDEKIGLSLRTSLNSDGIYVHRIDSGSKIESTGIQVGQKVLRINGQPCSSVLSEAIGFLRDAPSQLVLEVGTNDEAVNQIDEMAAMGNDITFNTDLTEIAVDGYNDSCGFFWSLQNGICAFAPNNIATETDTLVEEKKEGAAQEEEEEKPATEVIATQSLLDEPEKKKKMRFLKPSNPLKNLKFSSKSKKTIKVTKEAKEEETPLPEELPVIKEVIVEEPSPKEEDNEAVEEEEKREEVKDTEIPEGSTIVKLHKEKAEESVGLALRNSTVTGGIYVYGIFNGSKLTGTDLVEKMRIFSINGQTFSKVEEAVTAIKESVDLEFCAGPNDEQPPTPVEEEDTKEEVTNSSWSLW
jgi:hypothetical protein